MKKPTHTRNKHVITEIATGMSTGLVTAYETNGQPSINKAKAASRLLQKRADVVMKVIK